MCITHILLIIILINFMNLSASEVKTDVEEIINEIYPGASLSFSKYNIPSEIRQNISTQTKQKFFSEYVYLWQICSSDSIQGTAIVDNVYGKSQPITFLTIISQDGKIKKAAIIRYREPYGGAVASHRWLDQFIGLSSSNNFVVGREVDGITGATISVASVTKGIQKITLLWEQYIKKNTSICISPDTYSEKNAK